MIRLLFIIAAVLLAAWIWRALRRPDAVAPPPASGRRLRSLIGEVSGKGADAAPVAVRIAQLPEEGGAGDTVELEIEGPGPAGTLVRVTLPRADAERLSALLRDAASAAAEGQE
jgi:hypothetical protein